MAKYKSLNGGELAISSPFKIFCILLILGYSGVTDYLPFLSLIKPGLLCSVVLAYFWVKSDEFKDDIKNVEVRSAFALICLSLISLLYAESTGVVIVLVQTEIIFFLGFLVGAFVAIKSERDVERFILLWVFLGVLISIQVILNGGFGPSNLGDENDVSISVIVTLPFMYYGFYYFSGVKRWLCLIGLVISLGAIVTAGSRGGFLGLVAVVCMIFMFSKRKYAMIAFGMLALFIGVTFFVSQEYVEEMSTISDTDSGTADQRLYSWMLGIEVFKGNPILGVGTGQYGYNVYKYQEKRGDLDVGASGIRKRGHLGGRSSHSTYVDFLSERGLVGVFFAVALYRSVRKRLKNIRNYLGRQTNTSGKQILTIFYPAIVCALVGWLLCSAFVTSYYFSNLWLIIGLIIAVSRVASQLELSESMEK